MPVKTIYSNRLGRMSITASCAAMGKDLCIIVCGGEAPHLGAVAVAQARPSLNDPARLSASTSVLTLPGHKEDDFARAVARCFAQATGSNVVVGCGIHVDAITAAELDFVQACQDEICQLAVAWGANLTNS